MTEEEVAYLSNIVLAILCFVVVTALIGILFYFLGIIKIGDVNLTPQPAVPTATRAVVATSAPTPTAAQVPADAPTSSPQVLPLVVRETTQPSWLAVTSEFPSHKFQNFNLEIKCSGLGADKLKMFVDGEEVAAISYSDMILIQQGPNSVYLIVDQKCGLKWLDGKPNPNYATFSVFKDGGEIRCSQNMGPGPYSIVE